ncbi:MAG: histidine kinase [Mycobacterium sp.]|jgi:hypothetical protein|nr:histidine kinase [Mycobacterium sp.]MDT5180489.1 hypothetical protein [Mycobacterium sp.]
MTSPVPGFDEWLSRALTEEAAAAGESVDTFVARAVATRLLHERGRRGDGAIDELSKRIDESGLATDGPAEEGPSDPLSNPERLRVLYDTGLLDAEPDAAYDRVVGIAAEALDVPTAAVSLVDHNRQFLFSAVGTTGELKTTRQTTIDQSVCQYVVTSGESLIVEDARIHPLLKNHPTVTADLLAAYAGVPLSDAAGHTIGTLCVWDSEPRQWSTGHVQILEDLATLVRDRIFGHAG